MDSKYWTFHFSSQGRPVVDYWATFIGIVGATIFFFYLSVLIRKARRASTADRWLSRAFLIAGGIGLYSVYRLTTGQMIPYVSPGLWITLTVCEVGAAIYVEREIRRSRRS